MVIISRKDISHRAINMLKHYNIQITGKVQNVFFRISTKEKAEKLQINGFIKNENDGSIYMEVEGEEKNFDIFFEWLKIKGGPSFAEIHKIKTKKGEIKNFNEFSIQ